MDNCFYSQKTYLLCENIYSRSRSRRLGVALSVTQLPFLGTGSSQGTAYKERFTQLTLCNIHLLSMSDFGVIAAIFMRCQRVKA